MKHVIDEIKVFVPSYICCYNTVYHMTYTILVVEDDKGLQKYLKELLLDNAYNVQVAGDGIQALEQLTKMEPDVMVLDLGLPNMSGEAVCTEVRKKYPELPIIILTAKDSVSDIVQGLNLGADDYITKPFVADEFLARIKARLRQTGNGDTKLTISDLVLDAKTLEVIRAGKQIQLTPQEFKLLQYLMSNKGRILTREMILNRIWLYSSEVETRVVDVYMGYLRKKIDEGHEKKLLHSVRGFGYVIRE
jgi:DNA-binding response OmpR family regulator